MWQFVSLLVYHLILHIIEISFGFFNEGAMLNENTSENLQHFSSRAIDFQKKINKVVIS